MVALKGSSLLSLIITSKLSVHASVQCSEQGAERGVLYKAGGLRGYQAGALSSHQDLWICPHRCSVQAVEDIRQWPDQVTNRWWLPVSLPLASFSGG